MSMIWIYSAILYRGSRNPDPMTCTPHQWRNRGVAPVWSVKSLRSHTHLSRLTPSVSVKSKLEFTKTTNYFVVSPARVSFGRMVTHSLVLRFSRSMRRAFPQILIQKTFQLFVSLLLSFSLFLQHHLMRQTPIFPSSQFRQLLVILLWLSLSSLPRSFHLTS